MLSGRCLWASVAWKSEDRVGLEEHLGAWSTRRASECLAEPPWSGRQPWVWRVGRGFSSTGALLTTYVLCGPWQV